MTVVDAFARVLNVEDATFAAVVAYGPVGADRTAVAEFLVSATRGLANVSYATFARGERSLSDALRGYATRPYASAKDVAGARLTAAVWPAVLEYVQLDATYPDTPIANGRKPLGALQAARDAAFGSRVPL